MAGRCPWPPRLKACHLRPIIAGLMSIAATMAADAESPKQTEAIPSPTIEQLRQALDTAKIGRPTITAMPGCLPALGEPATTRVCVLQSRGSDSYDALAFRYDGSRWRLALNKAGEPRESAAACAPLKLAEAALRKMRGDDNLRVTGSVDEGTGYFTDRRGALRDQTGPYRLMCRYDVAAAAGGQYLYLTYVWHDGSRYVIDPDVEIWDN